MSLFLEHGIPTSVDFIGCDPAHMVASFNTGSTVIYDLETSQSVVMLSSQIESGKYNSLVLNIHLGWDAFFKVILYGEVNEKVLLLFCIMQFESWLDA